MQFVDSVQDADTVIFVDGDNCVPEMSQLYWLAGRMGECVLPLVYVNHHSFYRWEKIKKKTNGDCHYFIHDTGNQVVDVEIGYDAIDCMWAYNVQNIIIVTNDGDFRRVATYLARYCNVVLVGQRKASKRLKTSGFFIYEDIIQQIKNPKYIPMMRHLRWAYLSAKTYSTQHWVSLEDMERCFERLGYVPTTYGYKTVYSMLQAAPNFDIFKRKEGWETRLLY